MSNNKNPIPSLNARNPKNELKSSDDGKIGLIGADTKFDLTTRVTGSSPSPELPTNGLLTQAGEYLTTQAGEYLVWG